MRKGFIENEYDISLGASFFINSPILKKDWLYLILYFDELISLLPSDEYDKYKLVKISPFPFEIVNRKFSQNSPTDPEPFELNIIDYCVEFGFKYIKQLDYSERDKYLFSIGKKLPSSLQLLKKSFLTIDILEFFISSYISNIGDSFESDLLFELSDFKNSKLGSAFQEGIDILTERYSSNYYLTSSIIDDLKDVFLRTQNELLEKTNIEKIKSFDFSSLIEDGAGVIGSFILPILPLGTIKEIFVHIENSKDFKDNRFFLFVLSFFYIQKLISKYSKVTLLDSKCNLCSITVLEIDKMTEDEANDFVLGNTLGFCKNHMINYMQLRKFRQLTGKTLLINLKKEI